MGIRLTQLSTKLKLKLKLSLALKSYKWINKWGRGVLNLTIINFLQDVLCSIRADQSTNTSILNDIDDRIANKMVEILQSDKVNESEFQKWLANIDQELNNINCNMYKLTVNIDQELLAEGFSLLLDQLKPRLTEVNGDEDNIFVDKVSKELNDYYDRQECYAHLLPLSYLRLSDPPHPS